MRVDGNRLVDLLRVHQFDHLRRGVVGTIARLIVFDGTSSGAARHRKDRAAVRARAGTAIADCQSGIRRGRHSELRIVRGAGWSMRVDGDCLSCLVASGNDG